MFLIFSAILQKADLEKTSSKEVRAQLGKKLDCDFISRKAEIDKLVMEAVNAMNNTESEETSEDEKPVQSRTSSKKRKADSSEESDVKPTKSKSKKRKSSESSEDWDKQKKKKVVAPVGPKKRGKATSSYSLFIRLLIVLIYRYWFHSSIHAFTRSC